MSSAVVIRPSNKAASLKRDHRHSYHREKEDEVTNTSWIQGNLSLRKCVQFVLDKKADESHDDPKCGCGLKKSQHEERYVRDLTEKKGSWQHTKHTSTSATDAYGEIEFVGAKSGSSLGQKAHKFVRVDHKTDTQKLLHLLNKEWHLGTPKLIISVTGGALNFNLNSRLREIFRRGIIKAAAATGAWIITGGTHAGVMKYVGEAVKDDQLANSRSNIVAIGIATWGILDQKEEMQSDQGRFPAQLNTTRQGKEGFGILLDPNHTHFILVDNGTHHQFGAEIELRAKLEKGISTQKLEAGTHVPVVCIVVEGGPNTFTTAHEAVKNGTPIVVVANSGRAADVLSFAYHKARPVEREIKDNEGKTRKEKILVVNDKAKVKIAEMLLAMKIPDSKLNEIQCQIDECLQSPLLYNVFELDSGVGIDGAILNALMNANQGKRQDQLKLAQAWNSVDIAKDQLFGADTEWEDGDLNAAMRYAIINNQVEFVRLFLENGLNLKIYLTIEELTELYRQPGPILGSLLTRLTRKKKKDTGPFTLNDVAKVIKELTMDTYQPAYWQKKKDGSLKYALTEGASSSTGGTNGLHRATSMKVKKPAFKNPMRELFIYAVLNKYEGMSRLFWEEGSEDIAAALTASKMLKSMATTYRTRDADLKEEIMSLSEEYESLATGVLNECFNEDEDRTADILIRELPSWGHVTCLSLAVAAENKNFIAHSGVQNLLSQIWQGKLSLENNAYLLWLCTLCPLLIPFVVKYREDDDEEYDDDKSTPNQNGVQPSPAKQPAEAAPSEPVDEGSVQLTEYRPKKDNRPKREDSEEDLEETEPESRGISSVKLLGGAGGNEDDYEATGDVDIKDSGKDLTMIQRLILFYDAPRITFRHNVIAYLLFLALFSYIMLSNQFTEARPSIAEIVLIAWVFTMFVEECRQIAQGDSQSWTVRLKDWFFDYWNQVDLATMIMFATGVVLRFFPETLEAARIILALDLFIFFLRLLNIFTLYRNIGPKLVMIARMFVDLSFFICILFVFLLGYGITVQSILYPHITDGPAIIEGIFMRPYFQIYGELFLEDISPGSDCFDPTDPDSDPDAVPCPSYPQIGILLLAGYMMISNVLLLNLLIAMFSYTFEKVQENTDLHWKFQRYELIKEYFSRPPLVPPFIIISHAVFFIRFLLHKCGCLMSWKHGQLKQKLKKEDVRKLVRWEAFMSEEFMAQKKQLEMMELNEQVRGTGDRVDTLLTKVEQIFADPETGHPSKSLGLLGEKVLQERLNKLEDQLERTNDAVDWIINALADNKLAAKTGLPELKVIKQREEADEDVDNQEAETAVPSSIEDLGIMVHVKARSSPYPNSAQQRFNVPTDKVAWQVDFPNYKPTNYTNEIVLKDPPWADVDLMSQPKSRRPTLKFNQMDSECKYNRVSHMGDYEVVDGISRNPKGRTGMEGRGLLGRFGPNHAADPIVTRWLRRGDGSIVEDDTGKKVLEFVAIQRRDNQQWAIPGGMVEPGDNVSLTIRREFGEEALGSMDKPEDELKEITAKVDELFKHGKEVYKGYVDDPRNTDNAWMETVAMNFHDEDGSSVGQLKLQAGDDAQGVRWQRISSKISLFASHTAMLKKVAELHDASF